MRNKKEGKADMQVLLVEQQKEDKTEQVAQNNLSEKYDQAIEEAQSFYADQSGKVATISRSIVFGMIGTIWVVWYSDGNMKYLHPFLLAALIACFVYLLLDLALYIHNARFYHGQLDKLDKHIGEKGYLNGEYNTEMQIFSRKAYLWMNIKYKFFLIVVAIFIYGMCWQLFAYSGVPQ